MHFHTIQGPYCTSQKPVELPGLAKQKQPHPSIYSKLYTCNYTVWTSYYPVQGSYSRMCPSYYLVPTSYSPAQEHFKNISDILSPPRDKFIVNFLVCTDLLCIRFTCVYKSSYLEMLRALM